MTLFQNSLINPGVLHMPKLFQEYLCYGICVLTSYNTAGTFSVGSQLGATIAAIEANNDTYCLQKQIEKFPLKSSQGSTWF